MKKIQNKLSIFSFFKKWEKRQKIVFVIGLLIFTLTILFIIHEMFASVRILSNTIRKTDGAVDFLKTHNIYPSALNTIWGVTLTFTVMSNILLGLSLIIYPFYWKNRKNQTFIFSALAWISVTVSVYWILISWRTGAWKDPASAIRSVFLHGVNPIIAYVTFAFIKKDFLLTKKALWINNTFVIGYFIFSLIAFFAAEPLTQIAIDNGSKNPYSATNTTIYSFLNFKQPFFYKGGNVGVVVILDILIILLSFFLSPAYAYLLKLIYRVKTVKKGDKMAKMEQQVSQTKTK